MTNKKNYTIVPDGEPTLAEQTPEELQAMVERLQAELDAVRGELETYKLEGSQARAGYMVTTPNKQYAGMTAGIQFRGGRAFIPAGEGAQALAAMLRNEFGYAVEYVEDWQRSPEGEAVKKTFIDSLVIPDRR